MMSHLGVLGVAHSAVSLACTRVATIAAMPDTAKVRYRIERAAAHEVEREVVRLWRTGLPVEGDGSARFRWTYDDAPQRARDLYVLVADDRDRASAQLVGTAGVQIRRFSHAGRALRVALGCNLAIDPPHRSVLPALRLIRELQRDTRHHFALTYNIPNDHARGLYERAGFHDLGSMTRHVAILRHAPLVRRVVPVGWVAAAVAKALDAVQRARRARAAYRASRELRLDWLGDADDRFDPLWRTACGAYPLLAMRDARWLGWRYLQRPGCQAELAAISDRDGRLRGYAVIEDDGDVVDIRDALALPGDLGGLFALLLHALRHRRAATVSFNYLGRSEVTTALAAHGFHTRGANLHVYVEPGERLTDAERAAVLERETWYVTDFDKDN